MFRDWRRYLYAGALGDCRDKRQCNRGDGRADGNYHNGSQSRNAGGLVNGGRDDGFMGTALRFPFGRPDPIAGNAAFCLFDVWQRKPRLAGSFSRNPFLQKILVVPPIQIPFLIILF